MQCYCNWNPSSHRKSNQTDRQRPGGGRINERLQSRLIQLLSIPIGPGHKEELSNIHAQFQNMQIPQSATSFSDDQRWTKKWKNEELSCQVTFLSPLLTRLWAWGWATTLSGSQKGRSLDNFSTSRALDGTISLGRHNWTEHSSSRFVFKFWPQFDRVRTKWISYFVCFGWKEKRRRRRSIGKMLQMSTGPSRVMVDGRGWMNG